MSKYHNLLNQKFGRLTPLKDVGRNSSGSVLWLCRCDCGTEIVVNSSSLVTGNTKSCGCFQREIAGDRTRTHGQSNTKLYYVWRSMKYRCSNSNDRAYHNYGGRGLKVCNEWLKFEPFADWAAASGYKEGLTIERIDNDKGYEPRNCTWIPKGKQSDNSRRCIFITYKDQTWNLKQWAKYLGRSYCLLQSRLKRGWSFGRAVNAPITPPSLCHVRMISYQGEAKSIAQWSRELGISYRVLYRVVSKNSSAEMFKREIQELTGKPTFICRSR